MKRILRDNGLSIVVLALFLVFWTGQALSGHAHHNEELRTKGLPTIAFSDYVRSGHFISATMENWESEFLQMAVYVIFTIFLFQRGSSESKKIGEKEAVDRDPRLSRQKPDAPWPVRRGGLALVLYENSLSIAFVLLFLFSMTFHAVGGVEVYNEEQFAQGKPLISAWQYVGTSQFWFESFQNWQSEFLSLGAMAILSIFLRQRGSPESKPVGAPHGATGIES
jgi:hypothetical protein